MAQHHTDLPRLDQLTVACAHPDDESFGLGAVIAAFTEVGTQVDLVCLTRGENSTLRAGGDLGEQRARELGCAAQALGISTVSLLHHPDGGLDEVDLHRLIADIGAAAEGSQALLTYDHGGITGHPDHQRVTQAAIGAGRTLAIPVLAWALTSQVASALRDRFAVPFLGRDEDELDVTLAVDRTRQLAAIACHGSQLEGNPIPHARIELQGAEEHLRTLYRPDPSENPASSNESA